MRSVASTPTIAATGSSTRLPNGAGTSRSTSSGPQQPRRREASRSKVIVIRHPGFEPQRGPAPGSARRQALRGHRRWGRPRRYAENAHTSARCRKLLHQPHNAGARPTNARGKPYVGRRAKNEARTWAAQPVRFAFDAPNHDGDVGRRREEVDYERAGACAAPARLGHFEGDHRSTTPAKRSPTAPYVGRLRVQAHGPNCESFGAWRDRRRTWSGIGAEEPARALPVRGLLRRQAAQLHRSAPRRRDRALGVHVDNPSSFGRGCGGGYTALPGWSGYQPSADTPSPGRPARLGE